jgi:hypothetical protein
MSGSQPQGQRSGEGTSGLWNHIRDDDQRKEPDRRSNDDARQQYSREGESQQSASQG